MSEKNDIFRQRYFFKTKTALQYENHDGPCESADHIRRQAFPLPVDYFISHQPGKPSDPCQQVYAARLLAPLGDGFKHPGENFRVFFRQDLFENRSGHELDKYRERHQRNDRQREDYGKHGIKE